MIDEEIIEALWGLGAYNRIAVYEDHLAKRLGVPDADRSEFTARLFGMSQWSKPLIEFTHGEKTTWNLTALGRISILERKLRELGIEAKRDSAVSMIFVAFAILLGLAGLIW